MEPRTDQEEIRRQRRTDLMAAGVDVYPARTKRTAAIRDFLEHWTDGVSGMLAGRVRAFRRQGGSAFLRIEDETGSIQVFLQKKNLGDRFLEIAKQLDLGDFIEVSGQAFITGRGEKTVDANSIVWLAKALRPLPSEWHGLADIETRYRFRELDTLTNEDVKNVFVQRSIIMNAVRAFLVERGFTEVETPMLQAIAGGATARPFATHHHALDVDLFMRIAPELYLKRLIVGGFGRVFEIGRCFRNEGIDRDHNPEFTIMECYAAFTDYQWMMELAEDLVVATVQSIHPDGTLMIDGKSVKIKKPFPRISYRQTILEATKIDIDAINDVDELRRLARVAKTDVADDLSRPKIIDEIFKTHVRPTLITPTFVVDYPLELSPLAKKKFDDPRYTERFQLLMGGTELANAFSELNDPVDQQERFNAQEKLRAAGDDEAQHTDSSFVRSLEYGMPPTSGMGIGIDRLTALLTDQKTLKDVILFPTLKPEAE